MSRAAAAPAVALLLLAGLPVAVAAGAVTTSGDVETVRKCLESNAPRENSYQFVELDSIDHTGAVRHRSAKVYWKYSSDRGSKLLARVERPVDARGSAYLMIENDDSPDMFVYLPAIGHVRRINARAASGSLFGTDFSYEDMRFLQGIADEATISRGPDGDYHGRSTYVIESDLLAGGDSAYGSIRYHVDQATCSTLQVDFISPSDQILKQLSVELESLTKTGESWVAKRFSMADLENGTRTLVRIMEIRIDGNLKRGLFSQSSLIRRF